MGALPNRMTYMRCHVGDGEGLHHVGMKQNLLFFADITCILGGSSLVVVSSIIYPFGLSSFEEWKE